MVRPWWREGARRCRNRAALPGLRGVVALRMESCQRSADDSQSGRAPGELAHTAQDSNIRSNLWKIRCNRRRLLPAAQLSVPQIADPSAAQYRLEHAPSEPQVPAEPTRAGSRKPRSELRSYGRQGSFRFFAASLEKARSIIRPAWNDPGEAPHSVNKLQCQLNLPGSIRGVRLHEVGRQFLISRMLRSPGAERTLPNPTRRRHQPVGCNRHALMVVASGRDGGLPKFCNRSGESHAHRRAER